VAEVTGSLRFVDGPAAGRLSDWAGSWPPDEEILYYVGRASRMEGFTSGLTLQQEGVTPEMLERAAEVTRYVRGDSKLTDEQAAQMPNVRRMAEYRVG
jgi:hypothetical protein